MTNLFVEDIKKYELKKNCEVVINFRSISNKIPIYKKYRFDLDIITYIDLMGRLYIAETISLFDLIKEKLELKNGTIQLQSSYIGTTDNVSICVELITNDNYIRKIKINNALNE